jgi:hypothetical protein
MFQEAVIKQIFYAEITSDDGGTLCYQNKLPIKLLRSCEFDVEFILLQRMLYIFQSPNSPSF